MDVAIRQVPVERIRPLRHRVLRAGLPAVSAIFDGDNESSTLHFAAMDEADQVVGCVTLLCCPWPWLEAGKSGSDDWQLRGMAVSEGWQGQGVGRKLLDHAVAQLQSERQAARVWCNARQGAIAFYRKAGWREVGELFDVPTAGPHRRMVLELLPGSHS